MRRVTASYAIPTMRYRDAKRMADWLGEAFGFKPFLIVDDGLGGISHAQLVLGQAMIMVGDARDDDFGAFQQPATPGEPVNQSAYIVVEEIEEIYETAEAAGAEIVQELDDAEHGGQFFACRDPEGQLWNFGSYDPWAEAE
jgi:uncharacterized glyoxalase superfamily protein PhnB